MEELKGYFKNLNGEIITIEILQKLIPTPENIVQTLLGHQDNLRNVEVIREEQDARKLHEEIIKPTKPTQKTQEKEKKERENKKKKNPKKRENKKK
jgi:hypothetical protein